MRFQSSHVTSTAFLRTLHPALLTRMSIRGYAFAASLTIARMLSSQRTSSASGTARRPIDSTSAWNGFSDSGVRLVITRSAPARASARAKVCPSPRLAPVTMATFPVRSKALMAE